MIVNADSKLLMSQLTIPYLGVAQLGRRVKTTAWYAVVSQSPQKLCLQCGSALGATNCQKLNILSGCSAVGSAQDWGSWGRWFKSSHSDQYGKQRLLSCNKKGSTKVPPFLIAVFGACLPGGVVTG